ncbi:MAG TPA: tetratricopeptide repeat protein [Mycobacteriales bacterium]|jgi:serine/threonine-protein kinase PknG
MTTACAEPGCGGHVAADGYCDTCGTKARPGAAAPAAAARAAGPRAAGAAPSAAVSRPIVSRPLGVTSGSLVTGSAKARGSRRTVTASTRVTRRTVIGGGLVDVPPAPPLDAAAVVLRKPEVAEEKRFCASCGSPVGRSRGDKEGRVSGFCPRCRQPFDFRPKLDPGEVVGGQYKVAGCLAHGGLGWIYLARDTAVNDRWVVLKGLLNAGDEAAMAAAVAERRFLAEIQHPAIVGIVNFVTHEGAGFIVMEFVGGRSLKQLLKERRDANGGNPDPLPVDQAIAYVLAVLPAFAFMHDRGLVYCDFKPDNVVQVGDQVKLIDLGAVRRLDDPGGDVYGTVGFQAPEIAELGPSVASDVYTIGRTLAVLTLDFRGYQSTFAHALPDPADHPALASYDSFYRLLLKATAPHPDDRFQTVGELGDQLAGVLREVVALSTGMPQPGASTLFGGLPLDDALPALAVDPGDDAAAFLANLPEDPQRQIEAITEAVGAGRVTETVEVRLRRAAARIASGALPAADAELDSIEQADPWEWRGHWLRGVAALQRGRYDEAAAAFDRCRSEVPGELAPKLAAAVAAERGGDVPTAAALYDVVSIVDPGYVAAARGLARCLTRLGEPDRALTAFDRIPRTHREFAAAQNDAVATLVATQRFADAAARIEALGLDQAGRARLEIALYEAALASGTSWRPERDVRASLERALRSLADVTADDAERYRLVDRANRVRPVSLV